MNKFIAIILALAFLLLIIFITNNNQSKSSFDTTWKTTSANQTIELPLIPSNLIISQTSNLETFYDFTVDWGDGTSETIKSDKVTHKYAKAGIYKVSITGIIKGWSFEYNPTSASKILTVENYGPLQLHNYLASSSSNVKKAGFFSGCVNLDIPTVISPPDLSKVTSLENTFKGCSKFKADISNWDVSKVTVLNGLLLDTIISAAVKQKILTNWNTQLLKPNVSKDDLFPVVGLLGNGNSGNSGNSG